MLGDARRWYLVHSYICGHEILYRVTELQTCANRIVDATVIDMIVIIFRNFYPINEYTIINIITTFSDDDILI